MLRGMTEVERDRDKQFYLNSFLLSPQGTYIREEAYEMRCGPAIPTGADTNPETF